MFTDDEIVSKTESAFLPLRCVAEVWDYNKKLRFRVFDLNDSTVITFPREPITPLRHEVGLAKLLSTARDQVKLKGHSLAEWPGD